MDGLKFAWLKIYKKSAELTFIHIWRYIFSSRFLGWQTFGQIMWSVIATASRSVKMGLKWLQQQHIGIHHLRQKVPHMSLEQNTRTEHWILEFKSYSKLNFKNNTSPWSVYVWSLLMDGFLGESSNCTKVGHSRLALPLGEVVWLEIGFHRLATRSFHLTLSWEVVDLTEDVILVWSFVPFLKKKLIYISLLFKYTEW